MNTSQGKPSSFSAPNPVVRQPRLSVVVRILLACLLVIGLAPFSLTATQQAYAATTHTITYDADGGSGISLPVKATHRTGDMIAIYDGTGLARTGDTFTSWKATWSDGVEQEVTLGEVIALRDADLTLTAQYAGATLSKNSTTEGTLPVIASGWCTPEVGGVDRADVATITFTDVAPATFAKKWDVPSSTVDAYAVDNGSSLYDVYLVSSEVIQGAVDGSNLFAGFTDVASIDFNDHFDTSNVTNMKQMFSRCSSLTSIDIAFLDVSNVKTMFNMFYYCSALTFLDLSSFDTSSVTDMGQMFTGCSSLASLDVTGFDTSSVTAMYHMLSGCSSLSSLDVTGFDTSGVTSMSSMFSGCSKLTSLDVSGFNTSDVATVQYMFRDCSSLSSLDVTGFDTSSVTDMSYMFNGCSSLTALDVSAFDTSKVMKMGFMFYGCSLLSSLDVGGFDTSSVTDMGSMFCKCSSLVSLDVGSFDTSNVMYMNDMFRSCSKLTSLDLSSFDTSKVTNMSWMVQNCSKLTSLDLSSFDTSNVTNVSAMFNAMLSYCIVWCRSADEVTKFSTSPSCSIPAANFKVGKPVVTALSLADEGTPALSEASAIQPGGADVADNDAPQSPEATDPEGQEGTTDISLDPSTETSPGVADEGVDVSLETLVAPNQAHADETDASVLALGNGVEKGAVAKGDEIDYSLSVAYSGSADTKSGILTVTDVLPNHLSYVEGSASIADTGFETQFASEPTYDETTNTLTFSLTDIPAGSQVDVTFKALVADDATSLGQTLIEYVNQASVTCNTTTTLSNAVRHYSGSRSASTHLVTYSYSGDIPGAASSLPSTLSYSPGAEVALAPDVSVPGYTFSGWQVTGVTLTGSVFTMPDSDVTITGTWTKDPQYTLTYEWAGSDLPNNLPQMPVVTLTKGLDAPTPVYPVVGATQDSASENDPFASFYKDYEFMGWSSSAATTSTTQASLREVIQGDTTTTGSWQRRASDDPVVDPTDSNTSADDTDTSATTTSKTADTTGILIGLISLVMAVSATGVTLAWRRRGLRG